MTSAPLAPDATVAIIGASLAGLRAAEQFRRDGHTGPLILVGEELHMPYDRPPLSKQFLSGNWDRDRIRHRVAVNFDTVDLRLGRRATALEPDAGRIELDDGTAVHFDAALIATGVRPRVLPGTDGLRRVRTLRTLDDSEAIMADAAAVSSQAEIVVIGAGFIGAEVAATFHKQGAKVTVVEALATPFARVLGEQIGEITAQLQAQAGVTLRTGAGVARISESGKRLLVELTDGTSLPADSVVVGIGSVPATEWLQDSGLSVANGVDADERLLAAPNIAVAGDVANWHYPTLGHQVRVEHWTHAADSAVSAAHNLVVGSAAAAAYDPVLFFWSDQYDSRIQVLGHPDADDDVTLVRGSVAEGKVLALYHRGGLLSAVFGINQPRQVMAFRALLKNRASFVDALALAKDQG
jgi:3-phenylpropionate/trans-cinnamate dioxygenase ferredoxin reductase component